MCIIVVKPKDITITRELVSKMWQKNPNGCGLAYFDEDGRIKVHKGLMRLQKAWELINSFQDKELVIHFRLATHGKINPHQTHPFAVAKNIVDAKAYYDKTFRSVLFHNGIIDQYGTKEISDTLHFVTKTLADIPKLETKLDVLGLINDKFVLMSDNQIYTVGKFFEYSGLLCSNLYFIETKKEHKWHDRYLLDKETRECIENFGLTEEDCFEWLGVSKFSNL